MFVNGTFKASSMVDLGNGETVDIPIRFMPTEAGNHTLTWSWNDDGKVSIKDVTDLINLLLSQQ